MKKICIDLTPFVYGRAAGYNEFVYSLLDGLRLAAPVDMEIWLLVRLDQLEHFKSYEDAYQIKSINIKSLFGRLISQNLLFAKNWKFDFYLFTGNFAPIFSPGPYLLVTHDLNYKSHPENFSSTGVLLRKTIYSRSIRNAKVSVAISGQAASEVKREFGRESVVIYNPVREAEIQSSSGGGAVHRVICMTSLAKHKNIDAAYEACVKFASNNDDVFFDFIGNWRVEDFPCKMRHNRVNLRGYVSGNEKSRLLNESSCVLVPSIYEGFGIPYVEAMLKGKCLICSEIPIAREVAGGYPYFIKSPFSTSDIYASLDCALRGNFSPRIFDRKHLDRFRPKFAAEAYLSVIRENI